MWVHIQEAPSIWQDTANICERQDTLPSGVLIRKEHTEREDITWRTWEDNDGHTRQPNSKSRFSHSYSHFFILIISPDDRSLCFSLLFLAMLHSQLNCCLTCWNSAWQKLSSLLMSNRILSTSCWRKSFHPGKHSILCQCGASTRAMSGSHDNSNPHQILNHFNINLSSWFDDCRCLIQCHDATCLFLHCYWLYPMIRVYIILLLSIQWVGG